MITVGVSDPLLGILAFKVADMRRADLPLGFYPAICERGVENDAAKMMLRLDYCIVVSVHGEETGTPLLVRMPHNRLMKFVDARDERVGGACI